MKYRLSPWLFVLVSLICALGVSSSAQAKRRARAKRSSRAQVTQPQPAAEEPVPNERAEAPPQPEPTPTPAPAIAAPVDVAAESPAVERDTQPDPAATSSTGPTQHVFPALQFGLSLQALHRSFDYQGAMAIAGVMPFEHHLTLGPALGLDLELYPFAFWSVRVLSHFGLRADYQQLFATETELFAGTTDAQRVETTLWQVRAGLRGRVPLRRHELGVSALLARQRFAIEDVTLRGQRGAAMPSLRYDALAFALDTRLRFGAFTLEAELGARLVGDTGELQDDWQPVDHAWALDASCALAYRVQRYLELRAGFTLLRYAIKFGAASDVPALDADSALDLQLSGWLGLRFVLPSGAPRS